MYGLPMFQIIIAFVAFLLHIIAISTSYWTNFYAKNEFGVPLESGHLGLWMVCYNEPFPMRFNTYGREYCDLVDTMFRPPPFLSLAAVLAVVATLTILLYFPFAIMKQKYLKSPYSSKNSYVRYAGAFKLGIATMGAILAVLVMIFVSFREQELGTREFVPIINFRGYWVTKSWSFYLEAIVALILLVLAMLSLTENNNRSPDLDGTVNQSRYPSPYNIQTEHLGQQGAPQSTTLPRRTRNEYVDSPSNNNLRLPHSSQNSITGQADGHAQSAYSDRINDDDIDQVDEDTASPLDADLSRLNPHIRRSSRYPATKSKSPTTQKSQPLSMTSSQPFSYHQSPSTLNRNLARSSTDIRSPTRLSDRNQHERGNSLERNEPVKSSLNVPIGYKSSPSQRAYFSSNFSPVNNYELKNEPLSNSPLLSDRNQYFDNNQLSPIDQKPQRYRTRIISTETTTESTTSTTLKRPQDSLANTNLMDKSSGTIRYHNIDLEPIDR